MRLPVAVEQRKLTPVEQRKKRTHDLIAGRPRRLPPGAHVIKASIPPATMQQIDRMRMAMSATRPGFVRNAVDALLEKYGDSRPLSSSQKTTTRKPGEKGVRQEYLKIPFGPEVIRSIERLAKTMGKTRQGIISLAIVEYLAKYL